MPRWIKSRYSKDIYAEGVESFRSILEQGREEGIFNEDLDIERTAPILYNTITLLLTQDATVFQKKKDREYLLDLDSLLKILGFGLLHQE